MKLTYYAAASLDGYIADTEGGVDWLDEVNVDHSGLGYDAFYDSVDGLIMGRLTYEFILNYGSWPYDDKPTWIVTSQDVETLSGCNRQPASDLHGAYDQAMDMGLHHVWLVGGGQLASGLIADGLLTHIQVTLMPIVLGDGIRFMGALPAETYLTQESGRVENGCCELLYRVGLKSQGD